MDGTKYSPEDILQILTDFYNCGSVLDPEVEPDQVLTFDTTISEWTGICDLVEPKKLARCYSDLFEIKSSIDIERILSTQDNSLKAFCTYIANNVVRQHVAPITILGQSCMSASVYKTLIANLRKRGVDTTDISPSSKLMPLFNKNASVLLEEVSKLAPGSLTKFEFRENALVRIGWALIGLFILSIVIVPIIWHFHPALFVTLGLGLIFSIVGNKFLKPEKENIGDYTTVRDLVMGMQSKINC